MPASCCGRVAALERAVSHGRGVRHTPAIGRTHGVHAEPTTFGLKLLGWATELRRQQQRLATAFEGVRVGKLSGAVGTYANSDPQVEASALDRLGLEREEVATQVIPRDRHAALLASLAGAGSTLDRFATEIRHLQRSEVREAREPFAAGQKGSSAMPHKQNPIVSERISGLARVLRANAQVGLREHRPLARAGHLPLLGGARRAPRLDDPPRLHARPALWLVEGLEVDPERMLRNLGASHGLVFSGRVLLALVTSGLPASRHTRSSSATRCGRGTTTARSGGCWRPTPRSTSRLDPAALDAAFDLESFLRHVDEIFDRTLQTLGTAHA